MTERVQKQPSPTPQLATHAAAYNASAFDLAALESRAQPVLPQVSVPLNPSYQLFR